MAKPSLLLVDGDARSLRVLEVSLKKAGFNVTSASHGRDALQRVHTSPPDLIISDTDMVEMDGFAFCEKLKSNPQWQDIPFIFLTKESSIEHKIRGLELGVEDYLTKPIYIKEILTRIRILLQKHQRARLEGKRDNRTQFSGRISDLGVVDLIQTIEISRKSGLIHVRSSGERRAVVYFREGKVIDAEAGVLQGEDAIYRLLTWSDGEFEVIFRNVRRKDVIPMSSQGLLLEGMRRLDEWGRLLEQLPPLDTAFNVDILELMERLVDLPDELNAILKLFDGRRTLMDIVDAGVFGDLDSLEAIAKLYFEGLLVENPSDGVPRPATMSMEDDSGLFALALSKLNTTASPPPPMKRPSTDSEQEHTISDLELDMAGVDVTTQPQTSLVEAAIGAATPLLPDTINAKVEPPKLRSEQSDADQSESTPTAAGKSNVPEELPFEDTAPAQVVSSDGAEVATASGEFSISTIMAKGPLTAREIITINPNRGDDPTPTASEPPPDDSAAPSATPTPEQLTDTTVNAPETSLDADAKQPAEIIDDPLDDIMRHHEEETARKSQQLTVPSIVDDIDDGNGDDPQDRDSDESRPDDDTSADSTSSISTVDVPAPDPDRGDDLEDAWYGDGGSSEAPRIPAVGPLPNPDASPDRGKWPVLVVLGLIIALALFFIMRNGSDESSTNAAADAQAIANATPIDAGLPPADAPVYDAQTTVTQATDAQPRDASTTVTVADAAPIRTARQLYDDAKRAFRKKKHDDALELLDLAIEQRRSARYLTLKTEILMDKDDIEGAQKAINSAVRTRSSYAKAWQIKGELHDIQGQTTDAIKAYERFLQLEPTGDEADATREMLKALK